MVMRCVRVLASLSVCALFLNSLPMNARASSPIVYDPAPPGETIGGAWVWPKSDTAFHVGETIGFAAAGYAAGIVDHVAFTIRPTAVGSGAWVVACSPDHRDDTRVYRCMWTIPADFPPGDAEVAFDVYSMNGYRKDAADGLRTIRIVGAPAGSMTVSADASAAVPPGRCTR